MKDKIIYLLEFIVSLAILLCFQDYTLNVLGNFGIDLSGLTELTVKLIMFGIQVLLCIILYFIYKSTIKQNGHSFKTHFFKNLLYTVLILAVMTIVMNISLYFIKYIAEMFEVTVQKSLNFNILQNNISIEYIISLIKYALLVPFSCVIVYILGVERLFRKNGVKILMSGLIWALVESFNYSPNFLNIFFNVLPTFILGVFLSYIYTRNKNILYPIIIYGLYLLFSPILIGYLGW